MKNINPTHDSILKDLMVEIAEISDQIGSKTLELECLDIGKEKYVEEENWDRVESYNKRIKTVKSELQEINEVFDIRMAEYRRLKDAAENQNFVESFLFKNPQLKKIA